jgi:hypothetical protein
MQLQINAGFYEFKEYDAYTINVFIYEKKILDWHLRI